MTTRTPAIRQTAGEARGVECPNCGSDDVKSHNRQYDCRTCRPLGYFMFGTDIDKDDHWHHQCRNGHRWADPK